MPYEECWTEKDQASALTTSPSRRVTVSGLVCAVTGNVLEEQAPSPGHRGPKRPLGSKLSEGEGGRLGLQLSVVLRTQVSEPGLAFITWAFSTDPNVRLCKALQDAAQRHVRRAPTWGVCF